MCLSMPTRLDPIRGSAQVFEQAQAFVSSIGTTYMRSDLQPQLHTGVWIRNQGCTKVFGVPTVAAHECLDSQAGDPTNGY